MQKYSDTVLDRNGNAIQGASVLVKTLEGAPATIYSSNGLAATANPITTDSLGRFSFYAVNGRYALEVSAGLTLQTIVSDVLLEDPADPTPETIDGGLITNTALENVTIDGEAPVVASDLAEIDGRLDELESNTLAPVFPTVAALAAATIPGSLGTVRTLASVAGGSGGQVFKRDSAAGPADSYYVVISADGAKWKGTEKPMPKHFGAIDGTDITAGWQRFANYVASHNEDADQTSQGYFTGPVHAQVAGGSTSYSRSIVGKVQLTAAPVQILDMLKFTGFIQSEFGSFEYTGQQIWSQRTVSNAFVFVGCKYMRFGAAYVVGVRRWGVDCRDYTTEFYIDHIDALYCGASHYQRQPLSYTTHFRYGAVLEQRSVFSGTGVLPSYIGVGDGLIVNGSYYHIRYMDRAGGTFQVFPALDSVDLAALTADSTAAHFCIGGGFRHGDGETNAGYISRYSGLVNGHDLVCDDLYPCSVGKFASQFSDVGVRVGVDRVSAYRGGSIADAYVEGTLIFLVELAQGGESPYAIMQTGQFTPAVAYSRPDYIKDDLTKDRLRNMPLVITDSNHHQVVPFGTQNPIVSTRTGNTPVTTVAVEEVAGGYGKSVTLVLDKAEYQAHGYYSILIAIYGSTTGAPGSVTFVGSDGALVMGVASKTVTLGPCMILATYRSGNWSLLKTTDLAPANA